MKLQLQVFKLNTEIKAIGHLEVRLGHQASSLPAQRWVQIIQLYTVAGGFQPNLNKHIRQKWLHLPQKFGVKMKNIWVATTHRTYITPNDMNGWASFT